MNTRRCARLLSTLAVWMLAVPVLAGPPCVVCGEPTRGTQAVVYRGEAYGIHTYPCRIMWDQALEAGLLEGVTNRLAPGNALFDQVKITPTSPPTGPHRFTLIQWMLFLLAAMTTSGVLATFLGSLFGRPAIGAFLLGFFIPAVGMVLVPVLPEAKSRRKTSSKQETQS